MGTRTELGKETIYTKVFSKVLYTCKTFLFPEDHGAQYRLNSMPNILRNRIGNKAEKTLTKLRRTQISCLSADWVYDLLPAGISHWDVDLGFTGCRHRRLPPTLNESYKVQILLRASDANVEVSSFRPVSGRSLLALWKW